ncbi:glycosyl hydrolase family 28-related protein [Burkholderia sp. LMG 13014]|uniref:glycosyl hydrolase family 28-related protein n=1 Tax=Burkholderia sp. LMG 13014 TaxID=2709306 RepID=UPI001962F20B|nr:glycosyl hydrolase family 28-related protein [Burkholderia sp. LMG 13014]
MTTPTQLVPLGKAQWTDGDGNPLVGGNVYFYVPGTTTPKTTWQDQGATTPNTNPVELDARGEAIVWGTGTYRQMVYDVNGNLIYDVVTDTPMSAAALANTTGAGGAALIGFDGTTLDQQFLSRVNRVVNSIAALRSLSHTTYTCAFATGYYAAHDGGGGPYQYDPTDTTSADNGGTIIVAADGARWKLQYFGSVSLKQFGAKFDGAADDTATINAALSTGLPLIVPAGTSVISGTLNVTQSNTKLIGMGIGVSVFSSTSASATAILVSTGLNDIEIGNFTVTRSATATSGANGIDCSGAVLSRSKIRDVTVSKHWNGIMLGATDFSELTNAVIEKNLNVGLALQNTGSNTQLQWTLRHILSQQNAAQGILCQATAGPAQLTMGAWEDINTFANSGVGVAVVGIASCPIQDFRMHTAFLGQDGSHELYISAYGGQMKLANINAELAGSGATGPTLSTPASNTGSGFFFTDTNIDITMSNCVAYNNALDGFTTAAPSVALNGCRAKNNGFAGVAGSQNGVNSLGGRTIISGGAFTNESGSVFQKYGVFAADGNNVSVIGSDLTGNATATVGATANLTYMSILGCLPNTTPAQFPQNPVLVGGNATGGTSNGAGTINVAAGVAKNNTFYVNP